MEALNYLFCMRQRDNSTVKDRYIKAGATGVGLTIAGASIAYTVKSVQSYITEKNAQHCANLTLSMLAEVQRQIQIFNASCTLVDPGSNASMCNTTLLPKPVNTSCPDIGTGGGAISYLPTMVACASAVTFGLLMGKSILASYDQRNAPQKPAPIRQKEPDFFEEEARSNGESFGEEGPDFFEEKVRTPTKKFFFYSTIDIDTPPDT